MAQKIAVFWIEISWGLSGIASVLWEYPRCGMGETLQNLRSMAPMASEVQLLCFHFLQETSSTLQSILSPAGQNDRKRVLRQISNLSN